MATFRLPTSVFTDFADIPPYVPHLNENLYHDKSNILASTLRANFIRKVFGIVAIQLVLTFIVTFIMLTYLQYNKLQLIHAILIVPALFSFILPLMILGLSDELSRKVPVNYILLAIATLGQSYMVAIFASAYHPTMVLAALFLTAGVVSSLSLYAYCTKHEVTYFGTLIVLTTGSLIGVLMTAMWLKLSLLAVLFIIGTCVNSGLYLVYDVKMMLGRDSVKTNLDDYVRAAMELYLDVIRIFVKILEILGEIYGKK